MRPTNKIILGNEAIGIKGLLLHELDFIRKEYKGEYEQLRAIINIWLTKSPDHLQELTATLQNAKERRVLGKISNETGTMGGGITIPNGLMIAMEKLDPQLFKDKKKFNQFKKWFPQFKTY